MDSVRSEYIMNEKAKKYIIDYIESKQPKLINIADGNGNRISILKDEVYAVEGECNFCGECCKLRCPYDEWIDEETGWCKYLKYEKYNDIDTWKCTNFWNKAYMCYIFPHQPLDDIPEYCSYNWKKIE
jgi:hypothetical protein